MRRKILLALAFLAPFLFVLVFSVHIRRAPGPAPAVVMEVLDPSLEVYAPMWRIEVARRFPDAVVILTHGGDFEPDRWIVADSYANGFHIQPIQTIVRRYQTLFPGRPIVMLACNPGHLHMGIPGVWYANASVWCVPDRALTPEMMTSEIATETLQGSEGGARSFRSRWVLEPEIVGNIYEFVQD